MEKLEKNEDSFISMGITQNSDNTLNCIDQYIEFAEAVSRTTYKSIFIVDLIKRNFLYVSSNPLFLCGLPASEVLKKGYRHFFDQVDRKEVQMIRRATKTSLKFIQEMDISNRMKYKVSYDYKLRHIISQEDVLVNQQVTPLKLTDDGDVWLALCSVALSPQQEVGNITITCQDSPPKWVLESGRNRWSEMHIAHLSQLEKQVVILANQGYSTKDIATKMCKSVDSIKWYRKTLFAKIGVETITEAIAYSTLHKLI